MDKKQIIDKVVKLLALSENNTESAEAKSAKNMAAKLMAKHDIHIMETEQKIDFEISKQKLKRIKPIKYDSVLINAISAFNGVAIVIEQGFKNFKSSNIFIGRKLDIECNDYMVGILMQQRTHSWKEYFNQYKTVHNKSPKHRDADLWKMGFALGVADKLRELTKMKNEKIQEYGLVPISAQDQALAEYAKQHKLSTSKSRPARYKQDGYDSGKAAHIHKGIGKESEIKLIS